MQNNMENEYITPTIEKPVFVAVCSDFGYIINNLYKEWLVGNMLGDTYARNITDAIVYLHEFIAQYEAINSKSEFEIFMINGQLTKYGEEVKYQKVYSINGQQAKKYRIIK